MFRHSQNGSTMWRARGISRIRCLIILVVTGAVLVMPASTSAQAAEVPAAPHAAVTLKAAAITQLTYRQQIIAGTNVRRKNHKVKQLTGSPCLRRMAQQHAARMARQQRMHHQDLGVVLRKCNMRTVGENVAFGYQSGNAAVKAWMNSPGHRKNMLKPAYRRIGVGAKKGAGRWWSVQLFGAK